MNLIVYSQLSDAGVFCNILLLRNREFPGRFSKYHNGSLVRNIPSPTERGIVREIVGSGSRIIELLQKINY